MRVVRHVATTICAAVLFTAVVTIQSTPVAATAGESSYAGHVGVVSHAFWLGENDAAAELAPLADAGVTWIREDFFWDQLEPTNGTFRWDRSDNLMAAAAREGIDVLAILDYSARWASSDPSGAGDVHYPPSNPADFADFARAVAQRYGANGTFWSSRPTLTPRPLKGIELWNEPWGFWFWKSGVNPTAYARMALLGAQAVKSVAPDIDVLLPGDLLQVRTDGQIRGWVDAVLRAEPTLKNFIDAYSVHPYPHPLTNGPLVDRPDPRWDYGRIQLIADTTAALGAAKPIWITEIGWSTVTGHPDSVTEAQQAAYVRDAIVTGFHDHPSVENIFVYTWDRDSNQPGNREAYFGMRRANGTPKPAWNEVVALLSAAPLVPGFPPLTSSVAIVRGGPILAPVYRLANGALAVELRWSEVSGAQVDVFLDGVRAVTTNNGGDGRGSLTLPQQVPITGTTTFRVCSAGDSQACSGDVQVAG